MFGLEWRMCGIISFDLTQIICQKAIFYSNTWRIEAYIILRFVFTKAVKGTGDCFEQIKIVESAKKTTRFSEFPSNGIWHWVLRDMGSHSRVRFLQWDYSAFIFMDSSQKTNTQQILFADISNAPY